MNGALQRICDLIRKKGLTELQFCKATGIPQSTWYSWKQRDSIPTNRYMPNITTFLGVSAEYIISGEGENIQKIELDDEPIQIRVLGKVAAGIPIEAVEDAIGEETISKKMAETGDYFGLRISGDSMEPLIHHGSIVIVRQQDDVENGDIAIVIVNGEDATCKKIEKFENGIMLVPINKAYEEKFYTNEEIEKLPVRIIGKVVESRTKF